MKRDNDAALALGARPIQQHEPVARHSHSFKNYTMFTSKLDTTLCIIRRPKLGLI